MTRQARKGDLALMIGNQWAVDQNPGPFKVLSDPVLDRCYGPKGVFRGLINEISAPSYSGGPTSWVPTHCLLPLPPDAESRRLFAEHPTERGVGVE